MASSSPHNCQSDVAPSSDAPEQKPKVDPKFLAQLQKSEGTTKIVVIFAEGTEKALAEINDKTFPNRGERAQAVHDALVKNAADSQASVTAFLKQQPGVEWESRWINNSMYIKNADYRLVVALAEFPEVGTIREDNIVAHIMEPKPQDSLE